MSRKAKKARRPVVQRSQKYSPGKGREQTVVKAAEAPVKPHTHAPAPEAKVVAVKLAKEKVRAAEKVEQGKLLGRFMAGELLPNKAQAEGLSSEQLKQVCKARGWGGYSSLKKDQLVEHVVSGGAKYAPKDKGPKSEELRGECKARRAESAAAGSDAYRGYSSQNKAGLSFMLANAGAKPQLADGTYKVGTVTWLQQLCREASIKGYSGLKKEGLVAHVLAKGNADAKKAVKAAVESGELVLGLPTLKTLGLVK